MLSSIVAALPYIPAHSAQGFHPPGWQGSSLWSQLACKSSWEKWLVKSFVPFCSFCGTGF
jgi:hypothetical protein